MALAKIGKAAQLLGVSVQTLHAWEKSGELLPDHRSAGGTRYYEVTKILGLRNADRPAVGDTCVSSHDQTTEPTRQQEPLWDAVHAALKAAIATGEPMPPDLRAVLRQLVDQFDSACTSEADSSMVMAEQEPPPAPAESVSVLEQRAPVIGGAGVAWNAYRLLGRAAE
jgi:hypothetical protein